MTIQEMAEGVLFDARTDRRYMEDETGDILPILVAEYIDALGVTDDVADQIDAAINVRFARCAGVV